MENIEKKFPELINCLGNLDVYAKECNECKYSYPCYLLEKELNNRDFWAGKYRPGFGRPKRSRKYGY